MIGVPRYQHLRRNFTLFLLDYVVFSSAFALIGASTVVPDFVKRLTSDPQIIGLSGSLFAFFWLFPQLFMAQMINRLERRSVILRRFAVPLRVYFLILAVIMLITKDPTVILISFLIAYGLFAMGDGLLTIAWADLLGSTLPKRVRSTLYMVGQLSVAIVVLILREGVHRLLSPDGPPFPQNFAFLFGAVGLVFFIAGFFLANIKDEKNTETYTPGPTIREFLPFLGTIWRTDKEFRRFALTRAMFDLATMAIPFYIVYGENVLNIPAANAVGDSILVLTIGNAIGSLVFGALSHRWGSRTVIGVAGLSIVLHPTLALLSLYVGAPAWYAAFLVLGFASVSTSPGYFDWIITYAPEQSRPIYLGLTNTISAISSLAPALGGIILGVLLGLFEPTSAYSVLFIIAAVVAVGGLISTFGLVEPRTYRRPESEALIVSPSNEVVDVSQV